MSYTITVVRADGQDISDELAASPAIDADVIRGQGVGSLAGLAPANAKTALGQIIDCGHEWGTFDPEPLYALAERQIDAGDDLTLIVPDGWTVTARRA